MSSLLVTNDYPPKVGGIQSYLWELWRRLPPDETTVLTASSHPDAAAWDGTQSHRIERLPDKVLLPRRRVADRAAALATEIDASVIFVDPLLPLGRIARRLGDVPVVTVIHGAEVTLPGHLPGTATMAASVLRSCAGVVAAGEYPAAQAARLAPELRGVRIPPGVDTSRFVPLDRDARAKARTRFGLPVDVPVVLGVSRLVPRKGFDVLIDAVAGLGGVHLVIAGAGRDRGRLERRAGALAGRVHFLGRVDDEDLPALYGCSDVFSMLCRDRWGGLEAEGFGIVFLEAAACGVASVAGRSGGSHEAVVDGETGFVVEPKDVASVRTRLTTLLADPSRRSAMGIAARAHAETFDYERLVVPLRALAAGDLDVLEALGPRPPGAASVDSEAS